MNVAAQTAILMDVHVSYVERGESKIASSVQEPEQCRGHNGQPFKHLADSARMLLVIQCAR
jgi:hypothetical protein